MSEAKPFDPTGRLLLWEQGHPLYFSGAWYTAEKVFIGPAREDQVAPLSAAHRLETVGEPREVLGVVPYYFAMVYRVKPEGEKR